MFGRLIFTFFVSFFLLGCAQPKYVKDSGRGNSDQTTEEGTKPECSHQFLHSNLCLIWYWEKIPSSQTEGSLIFKTFKLNLLDQTPVETDPLFIPQLILWMPSMGHGSTPTQVQRIDTGTFRAQKVFFIMPGDWELKFQIKNGSEILDEAKVNLTF